MEDVAARRPARWWPGRLRRDHPVPSRRAPHLGLVAAAIAGVTLIVGAVSAVTAERTATAVAALPPPSDRTALADTAFAAAAREPQHQDRTTQLRDGDLQTALDQWIAAQPEINDAVVGVAAGSQVWSGSAARADGEPRAADVSVGIAVSLSTQAPLRHLPGAGVTYSNSNYLWLGLLLESVTDSTYGALLADRIAGPLGLPTVDLPVDERTGWVGAASGGVSATPADVARFFDALINRGELLSVDALDRMTDLRQLNGGLGIWPMCPCGERGDGVKWATGLGHFNGDGAAFAFPEDQLAVYLRIGGPGDGPITGERMVLMREELLELMRTTAIRTDGVDH